MGHLFVSARTFGRACLAIALALFSYGCAEPDITEALDEGRAIEGSWEFSLWDPTDSAATQTTHANLQIFERNGIVVGLYGSQRFEGWRIEDDLLMNVLTPDGTGEFSPTGTLRLTLLEDGTLRGSAVSHNQHIEAPTDPDGSVKAKFTDGPDAATLPPVDIWDALATHSGPPNEALAAMLDGDLTRVFDPQLSTTFGASSAQQQGWCDAVGAVIAAGVGWATGNVVRPMAGCHPTWEGGGYYVFGNTGPGSAVPVYTHTVYHAHEFAACTTKEYNFNIHSRGSYDTPETVFTNLTGLSHDWLSAFGLDLEDMQENIDQFNQETGGFAISLAYSTHSGNVSVYVNTGKPIVAKAVALAFPLVQDVLEGVTSVFGEDKVYFFAGTKINDRWHLTRNATGISFGGCGDDLVIIYLFGTIEVEYI